MIKTNKARLGGAMSLLMLAAVACSTPGAPATQAPGTQPPAGTPTADGFHIGVSNTIAGNGWREEMICSIRAQALASGEVSQLTVAHRNTDATGQLEDIRNLIAAGVDAIIVNPAGPDAVNAALQEAIDQGIVVVAVDQAVTLEAAYLLANNQEEYGYLGASWLFEQLGGSGDVVYMRGAAGATADDDRDRGWDRALEEYPDINVVLEVQTGWDQPTGVQQINDFLATGQNYDGIWTSGIDNVIVEALVAGNHQLVPIVGADNAGFVEQLIEVEGLEGAAVTNPASVGGAGVTLALQVLNGEEPAENHVLVDPEVWENTSDEGRSTLEEAADPDIDPTWPLGIHIPDWTTYSKEQILACQGPGE
ncbi:MAG TPA: substrate-binding domain-containing protein [Candidatus Limnocylindria bacterium]|nr:substrate-binding domain-containing protein [Candidatus Limnocylindria bacterium]